jgi:hypothetical protein
MNVKKYGKLPVKSYKIDLASKTDQLELGCLVSIIFGKNAIPLLWVWLSFKVGKI